MPDLYSYCHDDEQIKNMIIRQDYKIKWHYQKEMIYYLLLQGLVCFGTTSRHCLKVPEAAEKCSRPQGFPPRMINILAFERMINTLTIWSYDHYTDNLIVQPIHCPLLQIVMWFTTGQDVSTSDLNGENFYNMILSYHDVWYIIMWWSSNWKHLW